jgi:LmbE family N-acetylglucosaminyl deacetylase
MPYTGSNPDLIDLQNQITTNLAAQNAALAAMQTQIKQVTLTLEGELNTITAAFATLKAYVLSKIPN